MTVYSTDYTQGNGVGVSVCASRSGEIVFDLDKRSNHRRSSFSDGKLYQNLTVMEAKKLRKVLKNAIQEASK
ncbi:hypothetical protein ACFTUC_17135 [Streptomyces sp. NPDC056944]|uniref:hypothetical protein n=1 Tax=Streptomyces sp. NPDC056944 TaxID=3345972 RepID=UPI00362B29EB